MYVIFPLDELLDLHSAKENKRGRATLSTPSHTRHTEEVLPLSQPNQLLPNQLKTPLNKQPKTILQQPTPTPTPTQQQKAPPTPPQKQPLPPSQKPSLSRAPSKTSIIVTSPSITVPSQSSVSVTSSNQAANVKKSLTPQPQPQQTTTTTTTTTSTSTTTTAQLPPDPVTKRQRSSHSTSTETSSNSSTGAKGKALLSPQASGGPATNRASWAGSTTAAGFQESCPSRQGSFRASKDLAVSAEGNSLKVVEQKRSESAQDIAGSSQRARPPLLKSNSFRSHLSDSCALALRPRNTSLEKLKKAQATGATVPTPSKQPSPSIETAKKPQEIAKQSSSFLHSAQVNKTAEVTAPKPEIHQQGPKERQGVGVEGVKIKQEVPVQAAPPPPPPLSHHQITTAESLRIQQECLPAVSDPKALPANQRHPSGRSNRSGSQKLSDLPPSGSGGGARGAAGSSANPKTQGVLGSPRGLQQKNTVMASNEATFRDLTNPSHNESLKAHNAFTFKLVKTGPSSGALEESQSPDETSDHLVVAEAAGTT